VDGLVEQVAILGDYLEAKVAGVPGINVACRRWG
jgi:hypothetical protein